MLVGGEAGVTESTDIYNPRIAMAGLAARLGPIPDDYRLHVQIGLGVYDISYHPDQPVPHRNDRVSGGGSFYVGLYPIQLGNFSFGGSAGYTGVVMQRNQALSYLALSLGIQYTPAPY